MQLITHYHRVFIPLIITYYTRLPPRYFTRENGHSGLPYVQPEECIAHSTQYQSPHLYHHMAARQIGPQATLQTHTHTHNPGLTLVNTS